MYCGSVPLAVPLLRQGGLASRGVLIQIWVWGGHEGCAVVSIQVCGHELGGLER
ncbi:MAG: hypothetical protein ACI8X5_001770 [Planctomycetota bacterium]|jgi:hypothetical protein